MHTESSEKYVCSCSVGYVEDREKELGGGNNAKVKDYIKCGHDKKNSTQDMQFIKIAYLYVNV